MKYVIGIDGGGTKTILRASGLDGSNLVEVKGGPTNIHASSITQVTEILYGMIDSALSLKGLKKEDCISLCMGAAGVDREDEKKMFEKLFLNYGINCPVYVANDAETMLAAGAGKPEGIVVISGTGSIAYGRDKEGNACRAGGWGHLIGDEGSGYWIAKEAINAAVKYFDKRGEETKLLEMLMTELGIEKPWDFINFVYNSHKGKSEIAALAVVVDKANKAGDKVARDILKRAAEELFIMYDAVATSLSFRDASFTVVAGGSVLEYNDFIYDSLCSLIKQKYEKVCIVRSSQNAAEGAVRIALIFKT